MAARALWKGVIEFGTVAVPVKLYTAVRPQTVHFRMLHDQDETPIRQVLECPREKKEVPREHVVKGYELRKDQYVIVNEEELDQCGPTAGRTISVHEFVDADSIDPLYFQKSYWLGPDAHGEKGYGLLVHALRETNKAGICEFTMRGSHYLAALMQREDALMLQTLRYAQEVLPAEKVYPAAKKPAAVSERELKVAEQLIDSLAAAFEPEKYHDEYRDCIMKMVEAKAAGRTVEIKPAPAPRATKPVDLVDVLKASVAEAKKRRGRA